MVELTHENFSILIEILGTIAFATSGAFAAIKYKLDPFGVLIIAFCTSVGGGTIRDLLLDEPVFWMNDLFICAVIFITTVLAMVFKSAETSFKNTLFIFDSIGLGLFTIIGTQKGVEAGLHPVISVTLGTITGCFGGVLRDVFINRIPLLLHEEIYATACIVGGFIFIMLYNYANISDTFVQVITIVIIVLIRIIAVRYNLQIPKFYLPKED